LSSGVVVCEYPHKSRTVVPAHNSRDSRNPPYTRGPLRALAIVPADQGCRPEPGDERWTPLHQGEKQSENRGAQEHGK